MSACDLQAHEVLELLERWCSRAQWSRIPEFVNAAPTIARHHDGITAAVDRGMSNGRHEKLNKILTMINRAYGFNSAAAVLALIIFACGPITLELPCYNGVRPHSSQ